MRYKQLKFSLLIITAAALTIQADAQESVSAAGGNASGNGGSVSHTIGQVVYQTHIGPDASVAEGVQQPFEILGTTGTEDTKGISLSATLFPNPVSEVLQLQVKSESLQDLRYQLIDTHGKALHSAPIVDHLTRIDLHHMPASSYFLQIMKGKGELKTFKIIKN